MRLFIALLFVFSNAFAQPAQWPGVGKTADFITGKHGSDDDGHRWAAWRYLSADGFKWVGYTAVLRRDKVLNLTTPQPGEKLDDYLNRMWAANGALPCSDTAISSICDTARLELNKITPPEPPVFVVAKNGTSTTRPMYSFNPVTNTVGALISKRATVGATCGCWAYGVRKGSSAYCIVVDPAGATKATEVAICAPQ